MNRLNKIKLFYKISSEDILKRNTKEIQKLLILAGYSLPRYGADGMLGQETFNALLKFKKDNNLPESKTLSNEEFAILKNIAEKKNKKKKNILEDDSKISASTDTLLFGDSQMQGGIGQILESKYGGKRLYKPGSTAAYWHSNSLLTSELAKKPSKIVIHLNGNGISGTEELLDKIKKITPSSEIVWYGAPPATLKKDSPYEKVRTIDSLSKYNSYRKKMNDTVKSILSASELNSVFIDPFSEIFNLENLSSIPYTCNNCDGIHVPKTVAQKYYI